MMSVEDIGAVHESLSTSLKECIRLYRQWPKDDKQAEDYIKSVNPMVDMITRSHACIVYDLKIDPTNYEKLRTCKLNKHLSTYQASLFEEILKYHQKVTPDIEKQAVKKDFELQKQKEEKLQPVKIHFHKDWDLMKLI